ncbi:MAG: CvpA family protein [Flavobacteriales bacterium]|nr:CvpA family protein [Flavobacteriales bacterium]
MNYLDVVFIVPLIWAGFRGFKKGLIIEVSALIAFGLGIWGGIHFSDFVAELLADSIESKYVPLVSFAITFILIVAAIFVLGKMLEKAVNLVQLKLVNKATGAVFGVARIVLVISVLLVIVNSFDEKANIVPKDLKENSLLYQPLSDVSLKVIPALQNSGLFGDSTTLLPVDSTAISHTQ